MQNNTKTIISPVFISQWLVYYIAILYLLCTFPVLILLILLMQFFPDVIHEGWLLVWYILWIFVIFLPYLLARLCKVCISSQDVTVTIAGKVLRTIPASQLQLIAMAGNDREDVLCLSTLSMATLAQKEEQKLLKNYFTKYDVALRKGKQNWEAAFAKDYFNRLRRNLFAAFLNKDVILLPAHSTLQYLLADLYPQIPYRNLTETKNSYIPVYDKELASTVPNLSQYTLQVKEDGLHVCTPKKELWYMPVARIRTIVRVDYFTGYHRHLPHHIPVFVISSLSPLELAQAAPSQIYSIDKSLLFDHTDLLASHYCSQQFLRWKPKQLNFCPMHATPENEALLRKCYPRAQWVDLSELLQSDID